MDLVKNGWSVEIGRNDIPNVFVPGQISVSYDIKLVS